jgi:hypothetical protein
MTTIHSWKFQHNRNKFWTIDFNFLKTQLLSKNHAFLQASDAAGKPVYRFRTYDPVTKRTSISLTFSVVWDLESLNPELKNVPQVIMGTITDLPDDVTYINAPQIEVWFMEYIPKAGEEPWIKAPMTLPIKNTVIYVDEFINPQNIVIEGEAGFRVIHLPHLFPVWFKPLSSVADGVSVIVDANQRVIQIDTELFGGRKELCRLKIANTKGYDTPKFTYLKPITSPKVQEVQVFEIAGNKVPLLFGIRDKKILTLSASAWQQAKAIYDQNDYAMMEKTNIMPPLAISNSIHIPMNALVNISSRLTKVPLGSQWNDVQYPNPDPNSPWPMLTKPGVKRNFEARGSAVYITAKNGTQVEVSMFVTAGNYNPDVPGIYQPVVSLSIPDWPNPLNIIHKVWVVVKNEDGTDPPGVEDFYAVRMFDSMQITVPQFYPSKLLKGDFHGLNYYHFAGFADKGLYLTDYSVLSCPINWEGAEFPTDHLGTFEITGSWAPRYPWIEPDVLANPPKVILHVV